MRVRLRAEEAGAIYHVYSRGVDRRRIFVDDTDYRIYTDLLAAVVDRQGWHLLCYSLMPNHVHLIIETPDTNLGNASEWPWGSHALVNGAKPIPSWLAHRRLVGLLEEIVGSNCYAQLVATAERRY